MRAVMVLDTITIAPYDLPAMAGPDPLAVRDAVWDDAPYVLSLALSFHIQSGMDHVAKFCSRSMAATVERLIDGETGILIVAEYGDEVVGMAGGLVYPCYFNDSVMTGSELFWYVDEDYRGGPVGKELFNALEAKAKALGCAAWTMVALAAMREESVAKLYAKRGYRPLESTYVKAL